MNKSEEPLLFQDYLKKGYFDRCDYYSLSVSDTNACNFKNKSSASFSVPGVTSKDEGILLHEHTLYIYSDISLAQERVDIQGNGIKPIKLPCLHCFLLTASKQRPFVDVILNESWHLELFSCRDSNYSYVTHVRVSTPFNLHQLEGCQKERTMRWEEYPSYGVPNHPIEYCRPVPFPDKIAYLSVEEQQMTYSSLMDPEELPFFLIQDRSFVTAAFQDGDQKLVGLYCRALQPVSFPDIEEIAVILTKGEGVWIPVAEGHLNDVYKVFSWAEKLKDYIKYFYNEGYRTNRSGLCRGVEWYTNAIMYELHEIFETECSEEYKNNSLSLIDSYLKKALKLKPQHKLTNAILKCLDDSNMNDLRKLYFYDHKAWKHNEQELNYSNN